MERNVIFRLRSRRGLIIEGASDLKRMKTEEALPRATLPRARDVAIGQCDQKWSRKATKIFQKATKSACIQRFIILLIEKLYQNMSLFG
jgi:hypothetical protein